MNNFRIIICIFSGIWYFGRIKYLVVCILLLLLKFTSPMEKRAKIQKGHDVCVVQELMA